MYISFYFKCYFVDIHIWVEAKFFGFFFIILKKQKKTSDYSNMGFNKIRFVVVGIDVR